MLALQRMMSIINEIFILTNGIYECLALALSRARSFSAAGYVVLSQGSPEGSFYL